MSKYAGLGDYLRSVQSDEVRLTFAEIERIIGAKLPRNSQHYRAWWSNNPWNSSMTKVWLDAGYKSEQVDMEGRTLVFRRLAKARSTRAPRQGAARAADATSASTRHPLFGALKGSIRIAPGTDLTEPVDPEWGENV